MVHSEGGMVQIILLLTSIVSPWPITVSWQIASSIPLPLRLPMHEESTRQNRSIIAARHSTNPFDFDNQQSHHWHTLE